MTIQCKGQLLDLKHPKIMGILNITPDSFYDGGKNNELHSVLKKVEQMLLDGMDILDMGGQSSRPGADTVGANEELKRIAPYLEQIIKEFPEIIISVDTFWSKVAKESIAMGASLINDISAGNIDNKMFETIAELNVPYVLMHMQGTPDNMQNNPTYNDIILDVNSFFSDKILQLKKLHVNDIILDVGYGFGKSIEHNFQLLKNQHLIGFNKFPILTGISRKSMIYKTLNINANKSLNGTTALHMLALQNGANILRVHDVKEAKECIELFKVYENV